MGLLDSFLDSPVIGAGISGIASFLGGRSQNEASAAAAAAQMAFQERMSNTAHQREVADLRAAGLNPILSVNKGASTPSGATWSPINVLGNAVNSGIDAYGRMQDARNKERDWKIKEPLEKGAAMASSGMDTIANTVPTVAAAVQSAVATALDKIEEVKGTALQWAQPVVNQAAETKYVAGQIRQILEQPSGGTVSTAKQIAEVLFPRVRSNFSQVGTSRNMDLVRDIESIKDPKTRREMSIAHRDQTLKLRNPSFSRHGFR